MVILSFLMQLQMLNLFIWVINDCIVCAQFSIILNWFVLFCSVLVTYHFVINVLIVLVTYSHTKIILSNFVDKMLISLHCSPIRFYAIARMWDEAVKVCDNKIIKIKLRIGMCFFFCIFCRYIFHSHTL